MVPPYNNNQPYNPQPYDHTYEYQSYNGPPPNMAPPYPKFDSIPPAYDGGNAKGGFVDQKDDTQWGGR